MAHVAGTRRVRMVGAEHWTEQPEQELATVEAGGDTYAVHERAAVDSARVRLVLAPGEDAAAVARELHGEVVRDVRVFRVVGPDDAETAEALPEWRLTLPALDDPEHDPLPGLVARLAGASAVEAVAADDADSVADSGEVETVDAVVESDADAPEPVEEPTAEAVPASDVPLLEPVADVPPLAVVPAVVAAATPALEPVIPVQTFLPAQPVAATPALEPVEGSPEPLVLVEEPVAEDDVLAEVETEAAAAVEVPAETAAAFDDVFEDPFAVPAEAVMPLEADAADADESPAPQPSTAEAAAEAGAAAAVAVAAAVVEAPDESSDAVEPEDVAEEPAAEDVVEDAPPAAPVAPPPGPP